MVIDNSIYKRAYYEAIDDTIFNLFLDEPKVTKKSDDEYIIKFDEKTELEDATVFILKLLLTKKPLSKFNIESSTSLFLIKLYNEIKLPQDFQARYDADYNKLEKLSHFLLGSTIAILEENYISYRILGYSNDGEKASIKLLFTKDYQILYMLSTYFVYSKIGYVTDDGGFFISKNALSKHIISKIKLGE